MSINAPVAECYRLWSQIERFPEFMPGVLRVERIPGTELWHWEVQGPFGQTVGWDAIVDFQIPNKAISWHSVGTGGHAGTVGTVNFHETQDHRTVIHVRLAYTSPLGTPGEFITEIFKNPELMIQEALRGFKHIAERREPDISREQWASAV